MPGFVYRQNGANHIYFRFFRWAFATLGQISGWLPSSALEPLPSVPRQKTDRASQSRFGEMKVEGEFRLFSSATFRILSRDLNLKPSNTQGTHGESAPRKPCEPLAQNRFGQMKVEARRLPAAFPVLYGDHFNTRGFGAGDALTERSQGV